MAALLLPLPAPAVERYYAGGFYPWLQAWLTSWSNTTAFALFDVCVLVAVPGLVIAWGRAISILRRRRTLRALLPPAAATVVVASVTYLWFAIAWGFNYGRPPIDDAAGYDERSVTVAALRALADRAVGEVNALYAPAHAAGFPAIGEMPTPLVNALHDVERRLGRPRPTTPGRPKRTLFAGFFRMAGVDGMHAPFLLETLLNPDLTPPERPAVLAHEWAHLSGYAPEADASFVGLLAALRADVPSRYSAWLALVDHATGQLPAPDRRERLARLAPGPQADRRAIQQRLTARVDAVANASWHTYDQYLKSQGVREGIESYSRVVQLLLGTRAIDWNETPR